MVNAARDGNGVFTRRYDWTDDEGNAIAMTASRFDEEMDGVADELTNSIAADGQTTPTANLPMGTYKHTAVGNASARDQYLAMGQFQDQGGIYGTSAGSSNAYTLTTAPAIASYVAGQRFVFKANHANTGAATLNVSALGAKTIKKGVSSDLESGDIPVDGIVTVVYDGTNFQAINIASGFKKAGLETIYIPAAMMTPTLTNGCIGLQLVEGTAQRPMQKYIEFSASATQYAQFDILMPKSWDEGTVTFQPVWLSTNTDTGNVIWGMQGVALSNDDAIDTAFGTAQTSTDAGLGTSGDVHVGPTSSAITIAGTPAADDLSCFQLYRDGAAGGDTYTGTARLLGIRMFFTTNAQNDA